MPDPLTNREIEDVLSSIRRLVSEAEQAEKTATERRRPELLVLTPALRVDQAPISTEERPSSVADAEGSSSSTAQVPPFRHAAPHLLRDPLPPAQGRETEAEVISQAWEAELGEDAQPSSAGERPADDVREGSRGDDVAASGKAGSPRASAASADATAHSASLLEQRIAELEAVISQSHDEFEPDGSEPDAGRMPDVRIFGALGRGEPQEQRAADPAGPAPASFSAAPAPEERQPAGPGHARSEPAAPIPPHRTARREPPLQLVGGRMTQLEDVGPEISRPGQAPASEAAADTGPHGPADPADAEVLQADGEDIFVDEEVLRELIADVVREELQGTLGERITRNLRRMVHREVERALALRKYD